MSPDETVDALLLRDRKIIQAKNGYRFSIDPVLLCGFMNLAPGSHILDLGTGNGVIPLILAQRSQDWRIVGVERQAAMAGRARRSVELNDLADHIEIFSADVRNLPASLTGKSWDAVCANPPYRPAGSGRVAPHDERAAARHELAGTFVDFVRAAASLLARGGKFHIIFLAERLTALLAEMSRLRIEPKRLRLVYPRSGEPAHLVLVEGRKEGRPGLHVEPPLFIYQGEGRDYTVDVLQMYGDSSAAGNGTVDEKDPSV